MLKKDRIHQPKTGFKLGMGLVHKEDLELGLRVRGDVFFEMRDARTGALLLERHESNIITLDAGILVSRLLKDPLEPAHGINMLAVGTGATGAVLSPDAPDSKQRKLNAEIARKAFSSTTFRDASGNAVSIPTNVVDYTTTFGEAEAVGPLNEMGLISTISDNPNTTNPNPDTFPNRDVSVDVTQYDLLVNYLTFGVITKPSTAVLTITWRITT